jgi:hypothetical protein
MFTSSAVYRYVLPPIVSVQKKPNFNPFKALIKPDNVPSKERLKFIEFTIMVAVPQDRSSEVISQEYLVVALTEN